MQREIPQEGARSARDRRWRPRLAHQGSRGDDRRLVITGSTFLTVYHDKLWKTYAFVLDSKF